MVILFVICHLPRVLLDLHEVATLTEQQHCGPQRWTYTAVSLSHMLLVVFCSAKLLIYCLISSQIKQEFLDMMAQTMASLRGCKCCPRMRQETQQPLPDEQMEAIPLYE